MGGGSGAGDGERIRRPPSAAVKIIQSEMFVNLQIRLL